MGNISGPSSWHTDRAQRGPWDMGHLCTCTCNMFKFAFLAVNHLDF